MVAATGEMRNIGVLSLACRPSAAAPIDLGAIDYRSARWYETTAGIVDLPPDRTLSGAELTQLRNSALLLFVDPPGAAPPTVVASEASDGVHVRADSTVVRLNPGDAAVVEFFASRFGQVFAGGEIDLVHADFGPPESGEPPMGIPQTALTFPSAVSCDANGRVTVHLNASDPGNPRAYIDGQIYFVLYARQGATQLFNNNDFISVLVWNSFTSDEPPTWHGSMKPIFEQYGNLYPVMRDNPDIDIDLTNYDSVSANRMKIINALSVPVTDPRYMPVTRDLSEAKRLAMVRWLSNVGANGKPLLGAPVPPIAGPPVEPLGSKGIAANKLDRVRLAPNFKKSNR
jgi:hypothetical protein